MVQMSSFYYNASSVGECIYIHDMMTGRPQSTNSMAITDALTSAQFCVKKSRKMSSVRDIASTISHIHVREFQTQGTPDSHVYSKLELIRMMSDMYCLLAEVRLTRLLL